MRVIKYKIVLFLLTTFLFISCNNDLNKLNDLRLKQIDSLKLVINKSDKKIDSFNYVVKRINHEVDSNQMIIKKLSNEINGLKDIDRRLFTPKKIELYELIKLLTPPKDELGNWHIAADKNSVITWSTNGAPDYREGEVAITINNKSAECLEYYIEPCKWNVRLKGAHAAYFEFSITSVGNGDYDTHYKIEELLISKSNEEKYTYKLLKKCTNSASGGYYFYEIKIPNKNDIWMKYEYSAGSGGNTISLDFYTSLDYDKIDLECIDLE